MKMGKKGQAAVTDALIFMMICSGAGSLLIYVAGLYGTSTNEQILTIYNYEFAGTALVTLHYAKDTKGYRFMSEVKKKLPDKNLLDNYMSNEAAGILDALADAAPTANVFLCFKSESPVRDHCYPKTTLPTSQRIFASAVNLKDIDDAEWSMSVKLYY